MLSIAFVWHFHQPPYHDPETGSVSLPWVRLRALKDYAKMAKLAARHPPVRLTFNFTPCLLEQLIEFTKDRPSDRLYLASIQDAGLLSPEERSELLCAVREVLPDSMLRRNARLTAIAGRVGQRPEELTVQEVRDLQVWLNLAWSEPLEDFTGSECQDSATCAIQELWNKRWGYTERDKQQLFSAQQTILHNLLSCYQRLAATGQVELITSPYYHPILPLLIDFTTASKSESGAFDLEFRHPEHARLHLDLGLAQFERTFGSRPSGIWLPEMALSTESLRLLPDYDVKWTIGNSDLLVQTLGETALFSAARPWLGPFRVQETATSVLFRDKELSDLVGFVYNSWESKVAAADFVSRIERLARELPPGRPGLLVIALDGENAWEHYPNDGWDFLDTLYARLEASSLPTVTISDYLLQVSPEFRELPGLNPGSWIDSNFSVWRGSPSHDTAWRLLAETTKAIGEEPRGLHSILRAECSDWFWWLSDRHWSTQASEFERLFRANLRQAYRSSGISPPEHLEHPIRSNT